MSIPEVELQNASLQAAGRSGSNPWQLFLYFIFPIPLVFLVLISLPFPARYRAKIRVGILVRLCVLVSLSAGVKMCEWCTEEEA